MYSVCGLTLWQQRALLGRVHTTSFRRGYDFFKEKMIFVVYINNGGRNYGNKNQTKK